jgi:hypothetical protein
MLSVDTRDPTVSPVTRTSSMSTPERPSLERLLDKLKFAAVLPAAAKSGYLFPIGRTWG